jgi:hypothetical protein
MARAERKMERWLVESNSRISILSIAFESSDRQLISIHAGAKAMTPSGG